MRDLKATELDHVYGAGGCSPTPPSCYNPHPSGSKGHGSKPHASKPHATKPHASKPHHTKCGC